MMNVVLGLGWFLGVLVLVGGHLLGGFCYNRAEAVDSDPRDNLLAENQSERDALNARHDRAERWRFFGGFAYGAGRWISLLIWAFGCGTAFVILRNAAMEPGWFGSTEASQLIVVTVFYMFAVFMRLFKLR